MEEREVFVQSIYVELSEVRSEDVSYVYVASPLVVIFDMNVDF